MGKRQMCNYRTYVHSGFLPWKYTYAHTCVNVLSLFVYIVNFCLGILLYLILFYLIIILFSLLPRMSNILYITINKNNQNVYSKGSDILSELLLFCTEFPWCNFSLFKEPPTRIQM